MLFIFLIIFHDSFSGNWAPISIQTCRLDFGSWILDFGFCERFGFCIRLLLLHADSGRRIHPCFWTNIWRCPRWLHLIASWSNWSLLPVVQTTWPRPTHSHSSGCSRRFLSYTKWECFSDIRGILWQPAWILWIHAYGWVCIPTHVLWLGGWCIYLIIV